VLLGVVAALATGAAACAKPMQGQALAATSVPASSTTSAAPTTGSTGSVTPTGGNGDLSQQAQQVCSQLPKDAVTQTFGAQQVNVTADSGKTLPGGIKQITCVVTAQNNFRVNVVVQVYPSATLSTAAQYAQIMQRQYHVTPLQNVAGADVAGTFQQTVGGTLVDEGYAAKKDTTSDTVDVVLAGIADSPGIMPKLVTFLKALATD
jgi:hypothetical protein